MLNFLESESESTNAATEVLRLILLSGICVKYIFLSNLLHLGVKLKVQLKTFISMCAPLMARYGTVYIQPMLYHIREGHAVFLLYFNPWLSFRSAEVETYMG